MVYVATGFSVYLAVCMLLLDNVAVCCTI